MLENFNTATVSFADFSRPLTELKAFKIQSQKQIRELFLKSGMRLFYELNRNLNAYNSSFEDLTEEARGDHLTLQTGQTYTFSPPHEFDYR